MSKYDIYADIAERTNGDLYVGVVGPVRCGKSTFISSFMQQFVFPNIKEVNVLNRAKDELPQSGDGKLVMTTQPKFVPNEAVSISVADNVKCNIRMIDCVGFMVDGAVSGEEGKARMVKTPWSEEEIPFEEASEIGTKKVITEHSNIAIMLTTDGSFTSIDRANYIKAEKQTVKELKSSHKPFVIALNSHSPNSKECKEIAEQISKEYDAPVVRINAKELSEENVTEIFVKVLSEFNIKSIKINMPNWLRALDANDNLILEIKEEVISKVDNMQKIADATNIQDVMFSENEDFEPISVDKINLGTGDVYFNIIPKPHLFYKVLSNKCGMQINNDFELMSNLKSLATAKRQYDKLQNALEQAQNDGYGIVEPTLDEIVLEEPKMVKHGSKSGVQIKAVAPSLHIMRVDVEAEINPVVTSSEQSEEIAKMLKDEYALNPEKVWQTNMFGKTLSELVSDGMNAKIINIPQDVKKKMKRTMQRVTNEGKGGVLCILL